jgi:hypothetical protein
VVGAAEVGDIGPVVVLLEVARHAEVGEEEVEARTVRVGGGGGAAVAAGPAMAARELDAAAAAR